MATSTHSTGPVVSAIAMSRPIDRLPMRRMSTEPKEAMNCKSCRKRKIKCNRLRPSCEACQVFNCACVYDAVPKKRGPKTDVLEALLKRVNGLEKRLKDENKQTSPELKEEGPVSGSGADDDSNSASGTSETAQVVNEPTPALPSHPEQQVAHQHTTQQPPRHDVQRPTLGFPEPSSIPHPQPPQPSNTLLDVYFALVHGRPYHILDETATRQRWEAGSVPLPIVHAVHAVTARHASQYLGGHNAAVRLSEEYALKARTALDSDDPTVENVQAALLLSQAYFQAGKGKKSYMLLSVAISMAMALGLHGELPTTLRISSVEREGRRKLFWTCYLMDRFTGSGARRPSLISDETITLRLPAWPSDSSSVPYEGPYFSNGGNMPMSAGPGGKIGQSTGAMLVEIVRILGTTNRYLAAGGVKGDSHFPWHAQSNLSRIRQDLDVWAGNNQDAFLSIEALFGQPQSSTLVLSKLIYHLVHCLIYRPFLPVDLTELAGTGQHQSWQIDATNLCFLHANAIAELVEIGKVSSIVDWPAFVAYCLCTAGTIHVHGAHYLGREGDVFARSTEFLSGEMTQISDMRSLYTGVQHQRDTLQTVYACHSQLVKSLASNPMRFSPVFQMEDFFDRYPGNFIDGAHVTFSDISVDSLHESLPAYNGLNGDTWTWSDHRGEGTGAMMPPPAHGHTTGCANGPAKKRRRTIDPTDPLPSHRSSSAIEPMQNPVPFPVPGNIDAAQRNIFSPQQVGDAQTLSQNPFSPSYAFSPWPIGFSTPAFDGTDATANDAQINSTYSQYMSGTTQSGMGNGNDSDIGNAGAGGGGGSGGHGFGRNGLFDQQTPGGMSTTGSTHTDGGDKDPFLSLLEQLAENEHSQGGGPSDLDFFLSEPG